MIACLLLQVQIDKQGLLLTLCAGAVLGIPLRSSYDILSGCFLHHIFMVWFSASSKCVV